MVRQSSGTFSDEEHSSGSGSGPEETFERLINAKHCPLCHRPRLNKKAEMDIITHLAVCARGDWVKIGRIVVGNFVTASRARRRWYTRIISKVSSGDYRLGANSANLIVQNRMTGQWEEEKMQIYVRLTIRLLYKGAKSRIEGARGKLLASSLHILTLTPKHVNSSPTTKILFSIVQRIKYDDPQSTRDIIPFVECHRLNVDEILDPIDSFKTFNQFSYRKLKQPGREPNDPS
ncbi:hypothetical protein PILCRDRAFT_741201 [Piloderma croceum F 1598]|uniref:Uncharacterized protein n=1 Tax=Piloderma croceum (strain F 1598) TaxID=765440 RepID=A0A0C3AF34_PILCF|nr:hypothetical protein PILCRDRAFT_741201 [Piloderma croceum F 1598]